MKAWIVRFVSLYVFNVVVLLLIGWLLPGVRVGWAAFWAGLILTAATIWLKPLVSRIFRGIAAKSIDRRTKFGERLVQWGIVVVVEVIVWVAVVLLSGVRVGGAFWGFWGWVLPPIALLIAWAIYSALDDVIEARAGALYDKALGGRATAADSTPPLSKPSPQTDAGRRERKDGLTDEQRKMFDQL